MVKLLLYCLSGCLKADHPQIWLGERYVAAEVFFEHLCVFPATPNILQKRASFAFPSLNSYKKINMLMNFSASE